MFEGEAQRKQTGRRALTSQSSNEALCLSNRFNHLQKCNCIIRTLPPPPTCKTVNYDLRKTRKGRALGGAITFAWLWSRTATTGVSVLERTECHWKDAQAAESLGILCAMATKHCVPCHPPSLKYIFARIISFSSTFTIKYQHILLWTSPVPSRAIVPRININGLSARINQVNGHNATRRMAIYDMFAVDIFSLFMNIDLCRSLFQ